MKVLMTIKAPRGKATIYPVPDILEWWNKTHSLPKKRTGISQVYFYYMGEQEAYAKYCKASMTQRGLAVRAFMKEHKKDGGHRPDAF